MQLYIIRHAQSTNNALPNMRDRVCDPTLTDLGFRQAEILAEHLAGAAHPEQKYGLDAEDTAVDTVRGYGIERLYCSAMHRAMQTAQPVGRALGLNPEIWLDIHESGGIFLDHRDERGVVGYPGKNRAEILVEFPNYVLPDSITEAGWWDVRNGQEDWPACQARAIRVAHQLRKWVDSDETIAIVTHGGFIDALLKALTSQLPGNHMFYHHFNTAITRVDFDAEKRLNMRYLNRIPHLPHELVS
jgi:broad specificity phosphatase PhoE